MAKTQAQSLKPILAHHMHWELIDEYLAGEIDTLVKRLVQCTEEDLKDLQGQIKALQKLKNMPLTLKSEMGNQ